jgi:mono/diheme cytochrome c family protein
MDKAQENESKGASRLRRWSRRLLKIAIYGLSGLFVIILILITVTIGWRPFFGPKSRPLNDRKFEATEARLARGKYLVEGPMHCYQCHSEPDRATPGAPAVAGTKGSGRIWKEEGFPWLVTPNITPDKDSGAGNWTDDMLARAIREGISHDGRGLFPLMPFKSFNSLSDEDLASVIVYLRTIESVRAALPQTKAPFPFWLLLNIFPEPLTQPVPEPDVSSPVKRGEYLAKISDCAGCHTPRGRMTPTIPGFEFAGGNIFTKGDTTVATSNITPDSSGISYYDEALFIQVMRTGNVKARKLNPVMPWIYLHNMTDEDLTSLYAYLRTLKPVHHVVDNTEPPTYCRLCHQKHGYGERN